MVLKKMVTENLALRHHEENCQSYSDNQPEYIEMPIAVGEKDGWYASLRSERKEITKIKLQLTSLNDYILDIQSNFKACLWCVLVAKEQQKQGLNWKGSGQKECTRCLGYMNMKPQFLTLVATRPLLRQDDICRLQKRVSDTKDEDPGAHTHKMLRFK